MIRVSRQRRKRVSQGDVYRDVEFIESLQESQGIVEVVKIVFPMIIVLTQDCDLNQDFCNRSEEKPDAQLLSVLAAPMYNAEHVYRGEHLEDLGLRVAIISRDSTSGKRLRQNETPRYHYLEFPEDVPIVPSVIDFKHYFSVNVRCLESIRGKQFVCRVSELFREDVSHRFSSFLSRIGLP